MKSHFYNYCDTDKIIDKLLHISYSLMETLRFQSLRPKNMFINNDLYDKILKKFC